MVKQVIVVRTAYPDGKGGTFGLRTGKIAAQVAHASMKVFFDRRDSLETGHLLVPLTPSMVDWVGGSFAKIVLGVPSEEDLFAVQRAAQAAGLPCAMIRDNGNTEFHGVPTYTCVAIGPAEAEEIDKITGKDGVVKTKLL